jgi:hypothetical protein
VKQEEPKSTSKSSKPTHKSQSSSSNKNKKQQQNDSAEESDQSYSDENMSDEPENEHDDTKYDSSSSSDVPMNVPVRSLSAQARVSAQFDELKKTYNRDNINASMKWWPQIDWGVDETGLSNLQPPFSAEDTKMIGVHYGRFADLPLVSL